MRGLVRQCASSWRTGGAVAAVLLATCLLPGVARAACQFSPYAFFPDRNDTVDIAVRVSAGAPCVMGFQEGPGYHFTGAHFLSGPSLGILAKTGPTQFTYFTVRERTGADHYEVKICATVRGRNGCSTLRFNAEVE